MNYTELSQLKRLLKKYIEKEVFFDETSVMARMNNELLDDLAILVNRHLDDGKTIEGIIMKKVEDRTMNLIKDHIERSQKEGAYINPQKLMLSVKKSVKNKI